MSDPTSATSADTTTAMLEGRTLICDGCGRPVHTSDAWRAVLTLQGDSHAEVHCPECAQRTAEGIARDKAARWAAEAAGGSFYFDGHWLDGYDTHPVFTGTTEALVAAVAELQALGIEAVCRLGPAPCFAVMAPHLETARAVAKRHGSRPVWGG